MLKALLGLSPGVLALVMGLGGFGLGGAISLGGAKLWNDWVENPAIRSEEQLVCLTRIEKAAAEARLLEIQRQYEAGRKASEQFIREQLATEEERQRTIEGLENENAAYSKLLRETGRSCGVTADDIEFWTRGM